MKIVIIGPGALGSLFAALLAAGGDNDVWLLDHARERAARLNRKLLLTIGEQEFCRLVKTSTDAGAIGPADLVLLCVKSHDVAAAMAGAMPLFAPPTLFITLQNGISHLEVLGQLDLPVQPVVGVTAMGATLKAVGHVCYGGRGLTRIGFLSSAGSEEMRRRLAEVAELFGRSDIPTEQVENIIDFVWAKLLVNVGINALTVLYDCPNGELLHIPRARAMLEAAVKEGEAVARALGINTPADPVSETLSVCLATAANISSMLQDVRRGRPTEIAAINGALLARADQLGLPAPANRELVERIRAIEAGYLRTAPHGLRPDRP